MKFSMPAKLVRRKWGAPLKTVRGSRPIGYFLRQTSRICARRKGPWMLAIAAATKGNGYKILLPCGTRLALAQRRSSRMEWGSGNKTTCLRKKNISFAGGRPLRLPLFLMERKTAGDSFVGAPKPFNIIGQAGSGWYKKLGPSLVGLLTKVREKRCDRFPFKNRSKKEFRFQLY